MENITNNLEDCLNVHGIKKITTMHDLKKYFDLDQLDSDGVPKITTDTKTLIFTDNFSFNETYLIDLINQVLEERRNVKESVKVFYIDTVLVRLKLQAPNLIINPVSLDTYAITDKLGKTTTDLTIGDIEKTYLPPMILTINPITNEMSRFDENPMAIFKIEDIRKILEVSKLDE